MSAGTCDMERCSVTGRKEQKLTFSQKVLILSSSTSRAGHTAAGLGVRVPLGLLMLRMYTLTVL